jgi:hypothetical protein
MMKLFMNNITKDQCKDTGMAMVLLLLIFALTLKHQILLLAAIVVLVANMIYPAIYRPMARVWFGLSHLPGNIISRILLSIVFFVVVTPVGIIRRLLGCDSLMLKEFKASDVSVMLVRNHTFSGKDIEKPY